MKIPVLLVVAIMLFAAPVFSQSKIEADFGAGFMEGLSTKLKFGSNFQLGLCQGFAPGVSPLWYTGVELYCHFGKVSEFTSQRRFYVLGGLSSTLFSKGYDPLEKIMTYGRIGRTVNFSAKSGLNFDMGIGFLSADDIDGYHTSPTFTASIHYFMRF
jgi:hypothetical protein